MIGGETDSREASRSDLQDARARAAATSTALPAARKPRGTAEEGYLHCGPSGAGHFVKMVHNGIEYGLMAAYAEGLNILEARQRRQTAPRDRRRDHAAAQSRALSVRFQSRRRHRSLAPRQRGRFVAARPDRHLAARAADARAVSPAASPIPAKAAGPSSPPSSQARPRPC